MATTSHCSHCEHLASQGGGIAIDGGNLAITFSLIDSNIASARGGAISASGGRVLLSNATLFTNNTAQSDGATLYIGLATVAYTLPVPAGRYITASACEVVYTACSSANPCYDNCGSGNRALTPAASTSGCGARAPFNIQSCPWDVRLNSNAFDPDFIIGRNLQTVLPGALNFPEWPLPCLPGIRGASADDQEGQKTSLCAGFCDAGFYCPTESTVEPLICGAGTFCPAGSALPQYCAPGTYSNKTGLSSLSECAPCPPGSSCSIGSTAPLPCSPGSHAPTHELGRCVLCMAGSYQAASNATACEACDAGDFCPEGASLRLAPTCEAGTFANASEIDGEPECFECEAGFACAGGAARPTACSPGYFANTSRSAECASCESGTYQPARNATRCKDCELGFFCPYGASVPLPCPAGTKMDLTLSVMTSEADCITCTNGTFCPVGSANATLCAAGTYNALERQRSCNKCVAGKYQEAEGATACKVCDAGAYCKTGASEPLPCPGTRLVTLTFFVHKAFTRSSCALNPAHRRELQQRSWGNQR